ncbi:MAG: HD domain-containing phosphohydrolase [Spirochaetota bacterium]
MDSRVPIYLATLEKASRELAQITTVQKIPHFIATQISTALQDDIQYAFVDLSSNKIFESMHIDSDVKRLLPFFLDEKFVQHVQKLDWSIIDSRGVRFLFNEVFGQASDIDVTFLIIPVKKGDTITHFSVLWGGRTLEKIDKEEADFISAMCGAAQLRLMGLTDVGGKALAGVKDLKRKAFELRELAGLGVDLTSLGKEDFFGSFLLNVMGRALCKTAVIFLSTNENNTEYAPVASRGIPRKYIERIRFTNKNNFVKELVRLRAPIIIGDYIENFSEDEKEELLKLEASLLVPLVSKTGLIGILTLGERMNLQPYSDRVIDSIKIIGNQMTMAIENSKLSNIRYAFSRYVSHQLVDGILSDPDQIKLGGQRRKVTVLFADIRDFTTMAENMKPEDVVNLLNTYLSGLSNIVFQFEGTVDKYIGDCVMAVFGAPISHYNDSERAVVSAINMMKYVKDINIKRMKEGLPEVAIGIGINTGYAISGNMGSVDRMDYTVIGDAVNTAARLEELAEEGKILITREVYDEVKYLVEAEFVDTINVKGKLKPVDVYEVKDLIAGKYISVMERVEPYKVGHYLNVALDAELIGQKLGFSSDDLLKFRSAIMLMDVGRIGLNEAIFNKKEKLTSEEFEVVKSHVLRGAEYAEKKLKLFKEGIELIKYHHEFYDGSGYPDGLKGEEIPLWARIISVVESYHAMTSIRPFREPMKPAEAMEVIRKNSGKKYDPKIVEIYLSILNERMAERLEKVAVNV